MNPAPTAVGKSIRNAVCIITAQIKDNIENLSMVPKIYPNRPLEMAKLWLNALQFSWQGRPGGSPLWA